MSATKNAATYVGRIGGLAVALGVGAAIASGSGIAWADSPDSSPSSDSGSSSQSAKDSSSNAGPSAKADSSKRDKPLSARDSASEKDDPSHAAGKGTSAKDTDTKDTDTKDTDTKDTDADGSDENSDDKDSDSKGSDDTSDSGDAADDSQDSPAAKSGRTTSTDDADDTPAATPKPQTAATTGAVESESAGTVQDVTDTSTDRWLTAPITLDAAALTSTSTRAASAAVLNPAAGGTGTEGAKATPAAPQAVTRLLSALGLDQSATNGPSTPAQSPAMLAMLGWVRREAERSVNPTASTTAAAATYAAAAVVDPLPASLDSRRVGWVTGPGITNLPGGFDIYGTDLGIMWDGGFIDGERFVHVAFGDTFSGPNMQGGWRNNALLLSFDDQLGNGLTLAPTGPANQFIDRSNGQVGLFGTEVTVIPTAGINIEGTQLVNYMSVRSWDTPGRWTTNYSAISQFYPGANGGDWRIVPSTIRSSGWFRSSTLYRAGDQNFQQMAYVLQPEDQVAEGAARYLYAFGTPSGRAGSAYLSRVTEESATDLASYEYWDGSRWVAGNAAVAAPIIGDSTQSTGLFGFLVDWANNPNNFGGYFGGLFGPKTGGNVSEMSVQYNEYLGKYVVMYGDGNNDIQMRVADTPEGLWSEPVSVATSREYPGLYAPFIHPWSGTGEIKDANGDPDYNNLYWNMSLWGPYNVVLMETDLSPLLTTQV